MSHGGSTTSVEFTTFGDFLKYLRRRARMNQRDLAIAVNYSTAQISRLEQNQRLPDLATLVALFVPVLDLEDEPELVVRLLELAAAARGENLTGRGVSFSHTVQRTTIEEPLASHIVTPDSPPAPRPPSTLPVSHTPLLGRAGDLYVLQQRLLRPDVRLLTLSGPPGVGKTRLSLQLAEVLRELFADGVFFVALTPISDPDLVLGAIARAFGVVETGDQALIQQLKEVLQGQQVLLLLDNFEHLLPAGPLVAELLAAAPRLKVLVTSRAVLHLGGEHEFVVPPLALPDLAQLPARDDLARNPAVALFTARSQATNPDFALTDANAATVAAICVRLDGLPLALELAAARAKLLDPQALLTRLHHRLALLTRGSHNLPPRHQTLSAAIAWSYELLPPDEQVLFARLAIFVGGCTLESAEAVCGEHPTNTTEEGADDPSANSYAVLDGLQTLVDTSLVQIREQQGERRVFMLETIREYALERLRSRGEETTLRQRHAAYYLVMAESAEPELTGAQQAVWLARLETEHDNLRAALGWAREHDQAALGLRLAGALWRFWYTRGHLSEGRTWLGDLLQVSTAADSTETMRIRAKALVGASGLAWRQGDYIEATRLAEESLALQRVVGNKAGIAFALNVLANVARDQGNHALAVARLEESLALQRALGDEAAVATVLNNLGTVARDQGAFRRAVAYYEECLAILRSIGHIAGIANTLHNLADALITRGDYARASALLEESVARYRELADPSGVALALSNLHVAVRYQGDYVRATAIVEESLALRQQLGDKDGIASSLIESGEIAFEQGKDERARVLLEDGLARARAVGNHEAIALALHRLAHLACRGGMYRQAAEQFVESMNLYRKSSMPLGVARSLEGWATLCSTQGHMWQALRLLGAASALRERLGAPLPPPERAICERTIAAARAQLDAAACAVAWGEGHSLPEDQLVVEILHGNK